MIKCPDCGKEISDMALSCPNCGRPMKSSTQGYTSNPQGSAPYQGATVFNQQQTVAPQRKPKKKGQGCIIPVFISLIIFIALIQITTSVKNNDADSKTGSEQEKTSDIINVIEDVTVFSRITVDELKNIMGEPQFEEKWTSSTSKGDFEVTTLAYDKNSNHYEFIIADNSVVRLTIYSNQYFNNEGDLFSYSGDKDNMLKMFNVETENDAKVTVDNNVTYRVSPVNSKIADFDVQDIAGTEFGLVKITYNLKYFD